MEDLVRFIAEMLVENKEALKISTNVEENGTNVINLVVAKSDMGRVIGKGGKIAQSIRSIVKTAGQKNNARYIVKISEE